MRHATIISRRLAIAIVVATGASIGVGYAASLGLGSNQLHAWRQTLTKGTCNQTSATAEDHAFIRFDLSGCSLPTTAGADTATLTVFVTTNGNDTISLFPVYSSWSSSTLTWNGVSGLTIGSTATTSFSASSNGSATVTVTADLDSAIKAGTLWGWELRATSGTAIVGIGASENASSMKRPSMTLSYEK